MRPPKQPRWPLALVGLWMAFTVSLASWWLIFGLRQTEQIRRLDHTEAPRLERFQRMMIWEGAVLIGALFAGGIALFYHVRHERERHRQVEDFFATFTHDLKTSLASLRLQVESLQEDLGAAGATNPLLDRLVKDSVRLQLQLENSLFFANLRTGRLLREEVGLGGVVDSVKHHWPELDVVLSRDCRVSADPRALESVVGNILQNSVLHGEANRLKIEVEPASASRLRIRVADNGRGAAGDVSRVGELFHQPTLTSGTGVGLYLAKQLMTRMGGALRVSNAMGQGFVVELELSGRVA